MKALARDVVFCAKVLGFCALAGAGLIVMFGPLIVFLRIQCG